MGADMLSAREKFTEYLNSVPASIQAYEGTNPFWRRICEPASAAHHSVATWEEADRLIQQLSCGSLNYLQQPQTPAEFDSKWRSAMDALASADPGFFERNVTMGFLTEAGLLEYARDLARSARLSPTMLALRHAYYARTVCEHAPSGPLRVLEIGAAGAALKILLAALLGDRIKSYTIVDLPEVLPFAIRNAIEFFPEDDISINSAASARHVFLTADRVDLVQDASYDLILNTHSFQEMDDGVIANYFDVIYRSAAPGAVFFNANWRTAQMTRMNGEPYDNDPRRYPYRDTDEILYFGPCDLHEYGRARGRKAKVECVTSVRRL